MTKTDFDDENCFRKVHAILCGLRAFTYRFRAILFIYSNQIHLHFRCIDKRQPGRTQKMNALCVNRWENRSCWNVKCEMWNGRDDCNGNGSISNGSFAECDGSEFERWKKVARDFHITSGIESSALVEKTIFPLRSCEFFFCTIAFLFKMQNAKCVCALFLVF